MLPGERAKPNSNRIPDGTRRLVEIGNSLRPNQTLPTKPFGNSSVCSPQAASLYATTSQSFACGSRASERAVFHKNIASLLTSDGRAGGIADRIGRSFLRQFTLAGAYGLRLCRRTISGRWLLCQVEIMSRRGDPFHPAHPPHRPAQKSPRAGQSLPARGPDDCQALTGGFPASEPASKVTRWVDVMICSG